MTVQEVIDALKKADPTLPVHLEQDEGHTYETKAVHIFEDKVALGIEDDWY